MPNMLLVVAFGYGLLVVPSALWLLWWHLYPDGEGPRAGKVFILALLTVLAGGWLSASGYGPAGLVRLGASMLALALAVAGFDRWRDARCEQRPSNGRNLSP